MTRQQGLLRNPRILFWARALTELKLLNSIVVLFYLHRGLTLDQVFYLSVAWSVATLIFEVPTGYLADRLGRKRTLLFGIFLLFLAQIVTYVALSFPMFIIAFVLMSAGFSCFSGTEEAILYDSLKEHGEENNMIKHNGRLHAARHVFKIIAPTLGALVAKDLLEWQFRLLIASEAIVILFAGIMLMRLTEPHHARHVAAFEKNLFRQSLQGILGDPFLFRAAMNKILIFVASFIIWRVYQPLLSQLGLSIIWLGFFYFVMHLCVFALHWFMGHLEARLGAPHILFWSVLISMGFLLPLFVSSNIWIVFPCCLFAIIFTSCRESVFAHAINVRIASHHRATTLSNLQVLKSFVDIPILLIAGWLSLFDIRYAIGMAFALCFLVMVLFPVKSRDLSLDPAVI